MVNNSDQQDSDACVLAIVAKRKLWRSINTLAITLLVIGVMSLVDGMKWLSELLLFLFLPICVFNFIIHFYSFAVNVWMRKTKYISPAPPSGDEFTLDDVVENIDLGGDFGVIKFVYFSGADSKSIFAAKSILNEINSNRAQFISRFIEHRNKYAEIYKEYFSTINKLQIDLLHVYPGTEAPEVRVFYRGIGNDLWFSTYDGKDFGELNWFK